MATSKRRECCATPEHSNPRYSDKSRLSAGAQGDLDVTGLTYPLEQRADTMVDPNQQASRGWHLITEQQVSGKHADENEEFLAGEAHNGQSDLHQRYQLHVLVVLHLLNLLVVLPQLRPVRNRTRLAMC